MPPRIPDDKRQAILAEIKAGIKSCRGIAKEHGVSAGTVRNVAKDADIVDAFARAETKKATEAHRADHHARMIATAGRMIGLAESILTSFEQMQPEDWARVSPHSRGIVLGIAADKARDLGPQDDHGVAEGRSMLGALADGLQAAYVKLKQDESDGGH